MQNTRYALVAYVKSALGEFVENLRRELHPDLPHLAPISPSSRPGRCRGSESFGVAGFGSPLRQRRSFEVDLGSMETFCPVTPTVYIRVDSAAPRMSDLHRRLNTEPCRFRKSGLISHM